MSWDDLSAEIVAEFALFGGGYNAGDLTHVGQAAGMDRGSRFEWLRAQEASDPIWRAWISRGREAKRRRKVAADPVYAAKRKAQTAAAYQRRKVAGRRGRERRRGSWSYYELGGQLYTAAELARLPVARASAATIRERIVKQGWSVERAVTEPPQAKGARARSSHATGGGQ